ncbi:MAG: hypothetical protein ACXWLQ_01555 [Rhizomicrobium sp.]
MAELAFQLLEESADHVVYPFGVDVFGFDVAKRMSNVVRFRVALRERFGCSGHVSMQLWGYSAIGDLTVTVQEEPRFLRKKFQKKFARKNLSNSVTRYAQQKSARVLEKF